MMKRLQVTNVLQKDAKDTMGQTCKQRGLGDNENKEETYT